MHCREEMKTEKFCAPQETSHKNNRKMDVDNTGPNPTEELGLWKSLRQGGASSCFSQVTALLASVAEGGGDPWAGRGVTKHHSAAPCSRTGDQLTKLNLSLARGATFRCHSTLTNSCQKHSNVSLPHTPAKGTTKICLGENALLCWLQSNNPPFASLRCRCPSDQRENKSFLEYSLSFCTKCLPSHTKINLSAGSFPFVAQPSLWESLFLAKSINAQPN